VESIEGEDLVEKVVLKDTQTGEKNGATGSGCVCVCWHEARHGAFQGFGGHG